MTGTPGSGHHARKSSLDRATGVEYTLYGYPMAEVRDVDRPANLQVAFLQEGPV